MSPFYNVQTQGRDLGVAIKGYFRGLSYQAMISNGLGANEYIGASESRQFLYANAFGAYFYGARLSYDVFKEFGDRFGEVPASLVVGDITTGITIRISYIRMLRRCWTSTESHGRWTQSSTSLTSCG